MLNWLSYLNGTAHRSTERDSFSGAESKGQLDLVTRSYCTAAPAVVARGMLAMFQFEATDILSRIPIPTLLVAGERDQTCLPAASRFMADNIPGAQLILLPEVKHCGYLEKYEAFNHAVRAFASEQSLPTGSTIAAPHTRSGQVASLPPH